MQQTLIKKFNLNYSALIEASAGTGKTFTITYLVLKLLLGAGQDNDTCLKRVEKRVEKRVGPLPLENILIVTFTRAAASDLKARIREKIRQGRIIFEKLSKGQGHLIPELEPQMQELITEFQGADELGKASRVLLKAERSVDNASICTIHSFCNSALNKIYAFEAGEAFENTLVNDLANYEDEAYYRLWRKLFYREDQNVPEALLELISLKKPHDIAAVVSSLNKVRKTSSKEGVLGYSIANFKLPDLGAKNTHDYRKKLETCLFKTLDEIQCRLQQELRAVNEAFLRLKQEVPKEEFAALFTLKEDGSMVTGPLFGGESKNILKNFKAPLAAILSWYDKDELDILDIKDLSSWTLKETSNATMVSYAKNYQKFEKAKRLEQIDALIRGLLGSASFIKTELEPQKNALKCLVGMLAQDELDSLMRQNRIMSNNDLLRRLDFALSYRGKQSNDLADLIRNSYPVAMIDEFQDTDPIQFAIFKKLYLNDKAAGKARCYLIGDPKQSIYAFRGSDINSYQEAGEAVLRLSGQGQGRHSLDTNFRSAPKVVYAVNELFDGTINETCLNNEAGAFLTSSINFTDVMAKEGKARFHFKGESERGTYVVMLDPSTYPLYQHYLQSAKDKEDRTGKVTKDLLSMMQALLCAKTVKRILQEGVLSKGSDDSCDTPNVKPGDLAILVRTAAQSDLIVSQLGALGIEAVYFSDRSSVLTETVGNYRSRSTRASENAIAMLCLMEAMAEPYNRRLVVRLLGSSLLAKNGGEFLKSLDDESFEAEAQSLYKAQNIWRKDGFLAAFSYWYALHEGVKNLLAFKGGERKVTDFYHLAEIMQEKHSTIVGVQAQLRYFKGLLEGAVEDDFDPDAVKKRLESERDKVQIRTIHNSKGLEFPIVLMPFLWSWKDGRKTSSDPLTCIFYQKEEPSGYTMDLKGSPESWAAMAQSEREENVRLTYVALTRACAANFLFVTDLKPSKSSEFESLVNLVTGQDYADTVKKKGKEAGSVPEISLEQRFAKSDNFCFEIQKVLEDETPLNLPVRGDLETECSILEKDAIDTSFCFVSYTSLTRMKNRSRFPANQSELDDKVDDDEDTSSDIDVADDGRFLFPRGCEGGNFLHGMLEKTPFEDVLAEGRLEGLCAAALNSNPAIWHSWSIKLAKEAKGNGIMSCEQLLTSWFEDILKAPVAGDFSLKDLKKDSYIHEMDYLLPAEQATLEEFSKIVAQNALEAGFDSFKNSDLDFTRPLGEGNITGFINGSLDLVAEFSGAYYVIDYKSNYLGNTFASYNRSNIAKSMFEHYYDVQYLLYSLALHRFLQSRIPCYDYDKNFGGVIYLYLRGMRAQDPDSGIYHCKVSSAVVDRLDNLFRA